MKLSDLTEGQIIASFQGLIPRGNFTDLGSGDDCAVVRAPGGRFVVTTDVLVAGQHFRLDWSSPEQIGARAAAQNLADIAAMGAEPTALVVSLVLPGDLELDWLTRMVAGMAGEVRPTGAGIVGGDLAVGDQLVIAVTAHGHVGERPITRAGARPGDTVAVVGTLGRSAAGLAALSRGLVAPELVGSAIPETFREAVSTYRVPKPPLRAGRLAAERGATAMMDVSDGLVLDATRLAEASGVHIDLSATALGPDRLALSAAGEALGTDPMTWVLTGGEDHALLVTFPAHVLVTEPFRAIGTVGAIGVDPSLGPRVTLEGRPITGGWDHFHQS